MSSAITVRRDIMNTGAMADYLKISKAQLLRLCNRVDNPMPHFRMSPRVIRFDREKVDAWLSEVGF